MSTTITRTADNGNAGAIYSPCEQYRYLLWRKWLSPLLDDEEAKDPRIVSFVMLNPSTATETVLDPTITRCVGFAKDWGFDGLNILNCFAYRATKPKDMMAAQEPIGPENGRMVREHASLSELVICAWGTNGRHLQREQMMLSHVLKDTELHYLRLTKDGCPSHPLYLPSELKPTLWRAKS